MHNNYCFIDGSALLSDLEEYKRQHPELGGKKFNPVFFSDSFFHSYETNKFTGGSYRRTVFYFVNNDMRIKERIEVPDFTKTSVVTDMEVRYCGKRISAYKKAKEWLEDKEAPSYVTESLYKSEKAVDTQICCDVLILLALNKLDRIFLYSNDYDFIPLCRVVKTMGANINLVKLTDERVNKNLACECDGLHSFTDQEIYGFFGAEYM